MTAPGAGAADGLSTEEAVAVRVRLPAQLRALAGTGAEVRLAVAPPLTQRRLLDALERAYPALGGTVRDRATGCRRPFIRYFVGEDDLSDASPDCHLPPAVGTAVEAFVVVGAMAGG
jgi:molybdopterin converting factor small subunit